MNEFQLQELLTPRWLADGIQLGDERLMLVAWEVMLPSWDINDSTKRWNEPSIDFLGLDESGRLAAIELKMVVPGRKPAWAVLCQLTHRAVGLSRSFTPDLLAGAYAACRGGGHGRGVGQESLAGSLPELAQEFFEHDSPVPIDGQPMRRIVAATEFGPQFCGIHSEFNVTPITAVLDRLAAEYPTGKGQAAREFQRVRRLSPSENELVSPVEVLVVAA
ncbi:hypothetical protein OAM92_00420 [Acidimicrobiales bacterium]|nr:hypothetical protein [Acidimicrobiales bacterium]